MLPLLALVAVVAALVAPDLAFAAGGEGHEPHVANWWGLGKEHQEAPALGWLSITFLIFVGAVFKWAKKPLQTFLESRSSEVRQALEEATRAKVEAEARAAEYEERLRKLDEEIAALKDEFRGRGEAEAERIEAAARSAAERINKDTEDTIAAEYEKAREALKAEGARLALELAEDRIRGAVDKGDHERLYQSFIQDLSA